MSAFIRPNRQEVSRSFPVLGFNVHTGQGPSYFEIVLATDPELFRPDRKAARTPANFYSSRAQGPLPAERGDAVYLVPPPVLARFVGQPKLYYALAVYQQADYRNPQAVNIQSDARAYVQISGSFTGEVRGLTGVPNPAGGLTGRGVSGYGAVNPNAMIWGGDDVAVASPAAQPAIAVAASPSLVGAGNGAAANNGDAHQAGIGFSYDDGFDASLWSAPPPVPSYQAGDPMSRGLAIVQPAYQPSNPVDALRFMAEWLRRGERWRAGVPDTQLIPHSAICQLQIQTLAGAGLGTGFYIARDRILTCAHNVHAATSIVVVPGKNGTSEPYGSFTVGPSSWFVHPRYVHNGDGDFDLAVVKVTTPPPNGWHFDMLEELNQSLNSAIIVCGYAAATVDQDKQHLDGDAITGLSSNGERAQYNIQTEPGNSGSPVFYVWGYEDTQRQMSVQDIRIVGVHISGYSNTLNQACRLTQQKIAWIRNAENAAASYSLASDVRAATARRSAPSFGLSVGIHYDVELYPQPDKLSCWAGAMAMLVSYRRRQSITPESLAQEVGRSLRTSYGWDMLEAVKDQFGFKTIELPSNVSFYVSPEQWHSWLSDYGPLWVTTIGAPAHAVIVAGISGDLTFEGTTIEILNPWDTTTRYDRDQVDFNPPNHGRKYSQSFADFTNAFGSLGLADYGSWRVLYLPPITTGQSLGYDMRRSSNGRAIAQSVEPVEPDAIERMRQTFVANRNAGSPQNCITIMNAGLRAFYGQRLMNADGTRRALGSTVQDTMGALERYGLAQSPTVFEFFTSNNRPTLGVLRPEQLRSSVEAWILQQIGTPQHTAWYLFGLSLMDGYHSVTLAVDFNGAGDPLTRIIWADQHYTGWDDTTGQLDTRITGLIQGWWDSVGVKPRTRVTLWPLAPVATPVPATGLGYVSVDEGIEGDENEESVSLGLARGFAADDSLANCEAFCPVNAADDASTDHFSLSEFHSHDGVQVPRGFRGNVQRVMQNLEVLRAELGGRSMTIVSGFRSCEHNHRVGGERRSRHLCGQAADIRVADTTPETVHATIERLIGEGRMQQGGLGIYNTFVHYDVRGTRARWDRRRATTQSRTQSRTQGRALETDDFVEPQVNDPYGDGHVDPSMAQSFGAGGDAGVPLPWRVARALKTLRDEVNTRWSTRNKGSDGTIGDAAHATRDSDHNPWIVDGAESVVSAMDITHDTASGCTGDAIANVIIASRDARVKYIIWNRQIMSSSVENGIAAWTWRAYNGSNPHTSHIHISVKSDKASYDSTAAWGI
jgi:V8-like Glu-specific endopeptidase